MVIGLGGLSLSFAVLFGSIKIRIDFELLLKILPTFIVSIIALTLLYFTFRWLEDKKEVSGNSSHD